MKKKMFLTGATGLLGANLILKKCDDYQITAVGRNKFVKNSKIDNLNLNLENLEALERAFSENSYDLIVHTAGNTSIEGCERDKGRAQIENELIATNIAKIASERKIKLVHISTDHLFSGEKEFSTEEDEVSPVNEYARTKLHGEQSVLENCPDALVIRTNFYGLGHKYRTSFSDWIYENLKNNEPIHMYKDIFFTPIYVGQLIDLIDDLLDVKESGIWNVVGDERVSKLEFAEEFAEVFSLNKKNVQTVSYAEVFRIKRPRDMSLSNQKLCNRFERKIGLITDGLSLLLEDLLERKDEKLNDMIAEVRPLNKYLSYGKHSIDQDDIDAVVNVLKNGWLTQGPKVAEFEQIVANYVGAKYAVAVSSWTAGLHLSCIAAGVGKGDSVLTSPNSFVASSNCALYVGADPAFADIDLDTLNIDPKNIEKACKRLGNVKAIIPVHFGGLPCDMEQIAAIGKEYNAVIIEDAAHAIGATYADGSRVGNCRYSLMTGFSFHPVKNIASGEGGMITTNDEGVYRSLLRLRSHGINKLDDELINRNEAFENGMKNSWYYEMQELGFNYRITDIQCALGLSQFKKLDRFLRRRIEIAKKYDFAFSEFKNLKTFQEGKREVSGNHLYIVGVDFKSISLLKNEFMAQLKKLGINGHTHYIPIPIQPYYNLNFEIPVDSYRNAMKHYKSAITLPLYPSLSDDDVNYVIETLRELVG